MFSKKITIINDLKSFKKISNKEIDPMDEYLYSSVIDELCEELNKYEIDIIKHIEEFEKRKVTVIEQIVSLYKNEEEYTIEDIVDKSLTGVLAFNIRKI